MKKWFKVKSNQNKTDQASVYIALSDGHIAHTSFPLTFWPKGPSVCKNSDVLCDNRVNEGGFMTTQVQKLLHSFDGLSDEEQREAASEILLKTVHFDFPPLRDEDFVYCADDLFLALEEEENAHG